jgi:hypothetical protein
MTTPLALKANTSQAQPETAQRKRTGTEPRHQIISYDPENNMVYRTPIPVQDKMILEMSVSEEDPYSKPETPTPQEPEFHPSRETPNKDLANPL